MRENSLFAPGVAAFGVAAQSPEARSFKNAHLGDHCGHLTRPQFGDAFGIKAILVAKGEIVQEVVDRVDVFCGQDFAQARADPLDILDGSVKFKHLWDVSRSG